MRKISIIMAAAGLLASSVWAENFTTSETLKVGRSEPVYKTVTTSTPIRECWTEEEVVSGNSGSGNDVIGGLVGGAIGGALGSQVGKGSGKTAATIGGAIIGSMLGQGASRDGEVQNSSRQVQKCKTRYESHTQQVLSGYNNFANYKDRQVVKFSETPLEYITVYTTVSY